MNYEQCTTNYEHRTTKYEIRFTIHASRNSPLHLSRILYKSALFMQNKPNVKDAQINVNSYMKSKYEKLDTWLSGKNKPNSNPIKPNLVRRRRIANVYDTKDYRKKDDFVVQINKPNLVRRRRIANERKRFFTKGL
jgi:hypothetical protein